MPPYSPADEPSVRLLAVTLAGSAAKVSGAG